MQYHQLVSFVENEEIPTCEISADACRIKGNIQLTFLIKECHKIVLPALDSQISTRCDELWKETCFEMFFGVQGQKSYWELNVTPDGRWNVYRFSDYRREMQEETRVTAPKVQTVLNGGQLSLYCELNLDKLGLETYSLDVGITSVLLDKKGNCTYWALCHVGEQPDFHLRDSFTLKL